MREPEVGSAGGPPPRAAAELKLGLLATPNLSAETVEQVAAELEALLAERYPDVRWEVSAIRDRLVTPPVRLTELVDAARNRLLTEGWDMAVLVTELPLRLSRRPLVTHSSPTHSVALVSLPALGVLQLNRRLRDSIARAVGLLVGDQHSKRHEHSGTQRRLRVGRRLIELATDAGDPDGQGVAFLARVITGNVGLILGMIRANRPWRLIPRLSRALLGALAAASYAVIAADTWRIAANLDSARLVALTVISIATAVVVLIAVHGLWERSQDRQTREQVALFNLVTLITVVFGIASLYAMVFVASFVGAFLLIDSTVFEHLVRQSLDASDYLRLAWLAASLATIGGAVGGTLETDAAVREAAYAYYAPEDVEPVAGDAETAD